MQIKSVVDSVQSAKVQFQYMFNDMANSCEQWHIYYSPESLNQVIIANDSEKEARDLPILLPNIHCMAIDRMAIALELKLKSLQ